MFMLLFILFTNHALWASESCDQLSAADRAFVESLVNAGQCNRKAIHLTFDDGPMPGSERVLEALINEDVKATFFISTINLHSRQAAVNCNGEMYDVSQSQANRNQSFIRDLVQAGQHIASHGHQHHPYDLTHMDSHISSFYLGEQQRQREIEMSRSLLEQMAGFPLRSHPPVLYRMPYAAGAVIRNNNRVSTPRERDFVIMAQEGRSYGTNFVEQLQAYAQSSPALTSLSISGFSHLGWTYSSDDWNRPASVGAFVQQQVRRLCSATQHPTVALFHDIQPHTRSGMARIIKSLKCAGMDFIDIHELMESSDSLQSQQVLTPARSRHAFTLSQLLRNGPEVTRLERQCLIADLPITTGQCLVGGRHVPHGSCLWKMAPRSVCLNGSINSEALVYQEMCGALDT